MLVLGGQPTDEGKLIGRQVYFVQAPAEVGFHYIANGVYLYQEVAIVGTCSFP